MIEGEFILDGYAFGTAEHDVVILADGLDTGSADFRTQDAEVRDSTLFGRDYLSGPTWSFTLGINTDDADAVLADLARVWRNPAIRLTPGATSVLEFMRNGVEYRVYGRPRRFGVVPANTASPDWAQALADFKVDGAQMYGNALSGVTLRLGEMIADDGLILPETMPWLLGSESGTATAVANVQTLDPTPFTAVIKAGTAPLSNVSLEGAGWAIDLGMTIPAGKQVVIDTRAATALMDGGSVAGALSRRSSLQARLWAGASALAFTGLDSSGTATAEVSWRASYPVV